MLPRNLLVPLDGSRLAERSLVYVQALSRFGPLTVTLLSVIDEEEDVRIAAGEEAMERERNVLESYLREIAGDMQKHLNVEVTTEVMEGPPADLILSRCGVWRPDLLIVSTHGRSGLARWRVGSVADKLIRGAACRTLVVGPQAGDEEGWLEAGARELFKKILVPLDGSELGEAALDTAREYARQFDSELHLVRVVNLRSYGQGAILEASYTPGLADTLNEATSAYLDQVAARVSVPGGVHRKVLFGGVASSLEDYIEENGIDLVIMSTHGRGGLARAALGSVTDRLLGGPAPVLVIRPDTA